MVSQVVSIPLSKIRPNPSEPRKYIRPEAVDACAASMKAVGQKTPLKLRKLPDGNFELIGGQIRIAAAKKLGWEALDAIVLDIPAGQVLLEAILDNRDEEMTWLDYYQSIEALMAQPPKKTQQEVADLLEETPTFISRAINLLKALNKAAREAILASCKNGEILPVNTVFPVTELLDIPKMSQEDQLNLVEKTLKVILENRMGELQVKRLVSWVKKGGTPANFIRQGKKAKDSGPRFDPNDPNRELWKPLPSWSSVKRDKQWGYILNGKLDKFGAPYGIYCLLSGMMKYFQQVEKVRNPEVHIDNPFEAKLEELLEKAVREALEDAAQKQKEYDAKKSKKAAKGKAPVSKSQTDLSPDSSPDVSPEALAKGEGTTQGEALAKGEASAKPEALAQGDGLPSEEDLKRLENGVKDVLKDVAKDPKEVMKKLLGDIFRQP